MNEQTAPVGILGCGYETTNLGVAALASGCLALLQSSSQPTDVYFLDYSRQAKRYQIDLGTKNVNVGLTPLRFSWKLWLGNNVATLLILAVLSRCPGLKFIRRTNRTLATIQQSRSFISLSGGDSFSDIYGWMRLLYVCLPKLLIIACGKPLHSFPQTYGPFRSRTGRWLASFILKRAASVVARDRKSYRVASCFVNRERVRLCPDVAFGLPSLGRDTHFFNEKPIGINVSGLLYMGGYSRNNMFKLRSNYPQVIGRVIEGFVRRYSAPIVLIPHVLGERTWESDISASKEVIEKLPADIRKHVHLLDTPSSPTEAKGLISHCSFFIGSRMHACIAALSQGIPAAGLAYSRKFVGVFETVGAKELALDLRVLDEATLLGRLFDLYDQRHVFTSRLNNNLAFARQQLQSVTEEALHA